MSKKEEKAVPSFFLRGLYKPQESAEILKKISDPIPYSVNARKELTFSEEENFKKMLKTIEEPILAKRLTGIIKRIKEEKTDCIGVNGPFEDADLLKILDELKNSTKVNEVIYRGDGRSSWTSDSDKVTEGFGALLCHQHIKSLSFVCSSFSYDAFATFCSKAELGINLTSLSFYQVKFDNGGAGLIAKILEKNQSLTNLIINYCSLTSSDLKFISQGLANNTTLKSLSFAGNQANEDYSWVDNLVKVLTPDDTSPNTSLSHLNLSSMNLKGAAGKIADMIKRNHSLKELDLSSNSFFSKDVLKIFEALSVNKFLQKLSLHSLWLCYLDGDTVSTLKSYLGANKTITKLIFDTQSAVDPIIKRDQNYQDAQSAVDPIIKRNQKYQEEVKKYFASKQSEPLDVTLGAMLKDCIEGKQPLLAELTACELGAIAKSIIGEAASEFECL